MTTLRPYQQEACDAVRRELQEHRSTLLVLPTGCGKTQCFGDIVAGWPGRCLVLAHRTELVQQARDRIEQMTGEFCDVEQAGRSSYSARIVVGSMASVTQKGRLHRLGRDAFGLIVLDECHRARNASYERILEWFASAKVLGVTATPDRGDNKALGETFETLAYSMDILDAIDGGWLVPVEAQRIKVKEVDLSKVKATAGDLQVGQLDQQMLKACASVAAETCRLVGPDDGQGVVFFPGVESGMLAAEWFNRYRPDSARFICGQTPPEERAELFRAYARGDFQWLVNVMIATEGWDHPPARWCVVARPTKSRGLYAQMAGRCTRPLPGVVDGPETAEERRAAIASSAKPNCTILDFYGNTGRHDLCTPVDVLGGRFTDQEREEAKRAEELGTKPKDVVDTLQGARDKLRRVAAEHEARIKASVEKVNAFKRSGQDVGATGYREGRVVNGATGPQLALLAKMGVNHVPEITKKQASNLIEKQMKTRPATPAQRRALSFHVGAVPPNVRFSDAGRALSYINGCRDKGIPIRRDRVASFLSQQVERAR